MDVATLGAALGIMKGMPDNAASSAAAAAASALEAAGYAASIDVEPVAVTGTTPEITAQDNAVYVCGEIASLDFTPSAGICAVVFTSGTTPTVIDFGNDIVWPDWFDGTCEASRTYEISVLSGVYAAVMSWAT